jgi:hypothetical protein
MRRTLLLALTLLLVSTPAFAQVPSTMSYQGVLTDGAGNLVPDGFYDLTFRLYTVPTAGSAVYTEPHTGVNHVQVAHGGFSVLLGSITALGTGFDGPLYLGVQVAADPELAPRTALASSPYALGLRLPFALSTTTGSTLVSGYPFATLGAALDFLSPNGSATIGIEPDNAGSGGFVYVNGGAGLFYLDGNGGSAQSPVLALQGPGSNTTFDTNVSGDASVQLPANSVSAAEILDEPGVAQNYNSGGPNVPISNTMSDIVAVTITIPAPGYIVVDALGQHAVGGSATATYNYAQLQIDETAGGNIDAIHYVTSGYAGSAAGMHNTTVYTPIALRRTYFKGAGTYSFRLEGFAAQNEALVNYIYRPLITATYYPTSYGAVVNAPALAEAGPSDARGLARPAGNGPVQSDVPGVTEDLRDLELQAARAKADAEQAERRVLEARLAQQMRTSAVARAAAQVKK